MQFDNQKTRNVADIAAKIMAGETVETEKKTEMISEELKGNQHKIDKNKNGKIDAEDFKMLRKEDEEQEDETILEYESKGGVYRHKGTYGYAGKGAEHGQTDYKKADDEERKETATNRRKYGARQNFVRSTRVNEGFSDMLGLYKEQGLKGLMEAMAKKKVMAEEPTNEKFTKEIEQQQKKSVTKVEEETFDKVEVIDMTDPYDIKKSSIDLTQEEVEQVEEREMTDAEMKKREDIVKGMKKGMAGFKDRYGDRAKSVMYATATKQAMKD